MIMTNLNRNRVNIYQMFDVPVSLFNCTDRLCKLHEGEIDRLYGDIIKSLNMAANNCIPRRKSGKNHMRLEGATLNSGVLIENPDMDMCMSL